jgi:hypothetical protein
MSGLWDDFVVRPLNAVAAGFAALEEGLTPEQTFDAMGARLAQSAGPVPARPAAGPALTPADLDVIARVERSRDDGIALLDWFDEAVATGGLTEIFPLQRTFNRPGESYGFFGTATLPGAGETPVMGSVQRMFFDAPRVPSDVQRQASEWMRRQMREFALRYFMRVSDFRAPSAYVDERTPRPPAWLSRLSWCPAEDVEARGFGFSQLYYRTRAGDVGKFAEDERAAIVDVRDIGATYEWVVAKVRIFDFAFRARPLGSDGPEIVLGLNEESLIVLAPPFLIDAEPASGDPSARYGVGYAFIRNPGRGLVAYGPGQFDAAVQLIRFEIDPRGEAYVDMVFVANRPTEIVNLVLDPIDWAFRAADLLLLGAPSQLFAPVRSALAAIPLRLGSFDPIYAYVTAANAITGGQAASRFCISRDQLDRQFLLQHFEQHYQAIVGALLTWRQIPDWSDEPALPAWVLNGTSL